MDGICSLEMVGGRNGKRKLSEKVIQGQVKYAAGSLDVLSHPHSLCDQFGGRPGERELAFQAQIGLDLRGWGDASPVRSVGA